MNTVLIIYAAISSVATLNETARKIKEKGLYLGKIIELDIIGSFKYFNILNKVLITPKIATLK